MNLETLASMSKNEILIEALPYIHEYSGKYFVVKYGGHAMVGPEVMETVIVDLVLMQYLGIKPVLVHGGGNEVSRVMEIMGKVPHFINGLRVTDDETMEIVEMVLMGKINQQIVGMINQQDAGAVGLSGRDGAIIQARKKDRVPIPGSSAGESVDLGRVGDISQINPELIHIISDKGYIPVLSSIGTGQNGESLNINADYVAGELAVALGAEKLIFLTDIDAIYRKSETGFEYMPSINCRDVQAMISNGEIDGGMIPKAESCLSALNGGVKKTRIIDGRAIHSLIMEVFPDTGVGTMVTLY